MSRRATRVVGAILDFLTVVTKMIAIVRLQIPYLFQNYPATQRLQVTHNRRCLRVKEDPKSVQFAFKTAATWNLEIGDRCAVCIGTVKNRLVGIGLQICLPHENIKWIHCEICGKWFHHQCVDEDLEGFDISLEWICTEC